MVLAHVMVLACVLVLSCVMVLARVMVLACKLSVSILALLMRSMQESRNGSNWLEDMIRKGCRPNLLACLTLCKVGRESERVAMASMEMIREGGQIFCTAISARSSGDIEIHPDEIQNPSQSKPNLLQHTLSTEQWWWQWNCSWQKPISSVHHILRNLSSHLSSYLDPSKIQIHLNPSYTKSVIASFTIYLDPST